MKTPVSVIIPVYGVENAIERCARSLFEQTLDGIEYIFVNDCTPDNSVDILRSVMAEYPYRDAKIIDHSENLGQAASVKDGVMAATGEYIIRCDSDDEVKPEMYEKMYGTAKEGDYDIVLCDYLLVYDGGRQSYMGQHAHNGDELMRGLLTNRISSSICLKLAKRSIITDNEFIFPEHNMCEDLVYTIQYAYYAQKVTCIHEPYYLYYRYLGSYTAHYNREDRLRLYGELKANEDKVFAFLESHGVADRYEDEIVYQKSKVKDFLNFSKEKSVRKMWKEAYKEINGKIMTSKILTFKEKSIFLMQYARVYGLYRRIKRG